MMPHYLACTDYGATCGHGNTVTIPFVLAVLGVMVVIGLFWEEAKKKQNTRDKPREPRTDLPPAMYDLLTGTRHDAYTAPVRATTPGGIQVTHRRCCPSGHQTPAQAVAHAAKLRERIERTGR